MTHSTLGVSDFQALHAFRQTFPPRLLRQAVAATSRTRRRHRCLPAWLVLAGLLAWFFKPLGKLPALLSWLCDRPDALPSDSAIYQARSRLGWAPLRLLCRRVLRPLACPEADDYAFYHGRRLLALDGSTFSTADTAANAATFGRAKNQRRSSGYPLLRLVALCEVGTHALLHWLARSYGRGEQTLAARLWRHVPAGALLLADRNFHAYTLWQAAATGSWDVLLRVQKGPRFAVDTVCADGSYLSRVYPRRGPNKRQRALRLRVITYCWSDERGRVHHARLLTTLLDAAQFPAAELVALYHQRWEQEGVFKEIKGALAGRPMHLRAESPLLVLQELDSLLLGHYVLRGVLLAAARARGVPAVTLSFRGALRVLEKRLARVPRTARARRRWWQESLRLVGREQLPRRRRRRCPRKRKVTRSHWPVKTPADKELPVPRLEIVPTPGP